MINYSHTRGYSYYNKSSGYSNIGNKILQKELTIAYFIYPHIFYIAHFTIICSGGFL